MAYNHLDDAALAAYAQDVEATLRACADQPAAAAAHRETLRRIHREQQQRRTAPLDDAWRTEELMLVRLAHGLHENWLVHLKEERPCPQCGHPQLSIRQMHGTIAVEAWIQYIAENSARYCGCFTG